MSSFDYKKIKKDFPILSQDMNGHPLAFLDSAASSQIPLQVQKTFDDYYQTTHSNIHRGAYLLSYEATEQYDEVRRAVAEFIGAPRSESVIFTRNTTESINLIANSWGNANINEGDEIIVSELEHHSNLVPWMMLAERKKAVLRYLPLTADHQYDLQALDSILSARTKLFALSHASNAVGTIHDIQYLVRKARDIGACISIDGAQGAPHLPVNVKNLDVDFYSFSAHKMLGPTGVGVLYGRKEIMDAMPPYMGGGDMILTVTKEGFKPAKLPEKFEAGTPNIAGVIAFGQALKYLKNIGFENIHSHEQSLLRYASEQIGSISGVTVYGTKDFSKRTGVLSFTVNGVHPHDVGSILDSEGVAVRAGHHCCEPFMRKMDLTGTVRASFYIYNGPEDIDALVRGVKKVTEVFKDVING